MQHYKEPCSLSVGHYLCFSSCDQGQVNPAGRPEDAAPVTPTTESAHLATRMDTTQSQRAKGPPLLCWVPSLP